MFYQLIVSFSIEHIYILLTSQFLNLRRGIFFSSTISKKRLLCCTNSTVTYTVNYFCICHKIPLTNSSVNILFNSGYMLSSLLVVTTQLATSSTEHFFFA